MQDYKLGFILDEIFYGLNDVKKIFDLVMKSIDVLSTRTLPRAYLLKVR